MRSERGRHLRLSLLVGLGLGAWTNFHAQGVLTVTPGRAAATVGGSGVPAYSGDGGPANVAAFAKPSAAAYDAAGNLFVADANNHVVREISVAGAITTVAGMGVAGFAGDGGAATAALLDTPLGVAVDAAGNLYIADSHNHRIREVSGGTITTIAGTGVAGFAGDGGTATVAQLALPSAVAIDGGGNLYIADTNNQRVRRLAGGLLTTIAGNGEELFAGDGARATAASLDSPTGVALDAAGRLYIADRHNQRIRIVDTNGVIATLAGSASDFSGSYSGDGARALAATLAKPTGVSVDAAENIYIADTNNQRVRQVSGGTIVTVAGSGEQGFGGDSGLLTSALLNAPQAITAGATGNLLIADTLNQRLRSGNLPVLTFASQAVGLPSLPQNITLSNTGSASLTVSQINVSGAFTVASAGTCTPLPITLVPGATCTENISFLPAASGAAAGSVLVSGSGLVPQTVLLAGVGIQGTASITLAADSASVLIGSPIVFTATVKPARAGLVTGTVSFYDGATALGTAQTLVNSTASITIANLSAGTHSITAVYSGDASFTGSTSASVPELIGDFEVALVPNSSNPAGSVEQTVIPGQSATYALVLQPLSGPFNFPVTLSATGLPPGATVTFSPQTVTVGAAPANFTMTIRTTTMSSLREPKLTGGGAVAFAFLLLPFVGAMRRRAKRFGPLAAVVIVVGSGIGLASLAGCGSSNGFFGQPQKTYTIQVIGTAKNPTGATLQHVASVKLTLQ